MAEKMREKYILDGRNFLNRTTSKYDVIFNDAYQSLTTIPYHLTTIEAVQKMYDALNEDGLVMSNIISAIEGDKGKFLRAEYATYKSVFPQVYVFNVKGLNGDQLQSIMLVALKSSEKPAFKSDDAELNGYLGRLWKNEIKTDLPILTDDYAPVDYYIRQAF